MNDDELLPQWHRTGRKATILCPQCDKESVVPIDHVTVVVVLYPNQGTNDFHQKSWCKWCQDTFQMCTARRVPEGTWPRASEVALAYGAKEEVYLVSSVPETGTPLVQEEVALFAANRAHLGEKWDPWNSFNNTQAIWIEREV